MLTSDLTYDSLLGSRRLEESDADLPQSHLSRLDLTYPGYNERLLRVSLKVHHESLETEDKGNGREDA